METEYTAERHSLKWLGKVRRDLRKFLKSPPFAGNEVSEAEYEIAIGDDTAIAFFRCRHIDVRRYRVPSGKERLFERVEMAFDAIENAALAHTMLRSSIRDGSLSLSPAFVDDLATECINAGILAAQISRDLQHRQLSAPPKSKVFDDPELAKAATDEIKRQLRSRLRWTPATDRAALALRSKGITVIGKTLRNNFPELKPKKNG